MTGTVNLDIALIGATQINKTATMNAAIAAMDTAMADRLSVDASLNPTPYTIPYDNTQDEPAGIKTALRFISLVVTGALSAGWVTQLPVGPKKIFFATNSTTGGHNITIKATGGTGIVLTPGESSFLYLNGTDVERITITPTFYDIQEYLPGKPPASAGSSTRLLRHTASRAFTLPINLTGSKASAGAAATALANFDIRQNGVSKGTLSFAIAATVATFTFASAISFAPGDVLEIVPPAAQDATLSDVAVTLIAQIA